MNKSEFIKELSKQTKYDEEKCTLINSIIEDTFIIGKKNKEKMKEKMEPDKVLRFAIVAVILLFLIGALIIGTRMMRQIKTSF